MTGPTYTSVSVHVCMHTHVCLVAHVPNTYFEKCHCESWDMPTQPCSLISLVHFPIPDFVSWCPIWFWILVVNLFRSIRIWWSVSFHRSFLKVSCYQRYCQSQSLAWERRQARIVVNCIFPIDIMSSGGLYGPLYKMGPHRYAKSLRINEEDKTQRQVKDSSKTGAKNKRHLRRELC